ncbi:MAG: anti-sigma factor domain-containing protein [Clostridium sp.]|nr:anti-sigma factor domain-containing protein [Clostridium sp.]
MSRMGVVYEMEESKALVLTPEGEFVVVKRQNHMLPGQQIIFDDKDMYNEKKWINKYTAIASAAAAVFIAVFLLMGFFNSDDVYCFVNIDINPSFEFLLDSEYKVIEAKAINNDAKILLDNMEINQKPMKDVFLDLIKKSIDFEFIDAKTQDVILFSAALNEEGFNMKRNKDEQNILEFIESMDDLVAEFNDEFNILVKALKVTAKEREEALENNISMGKYSLYLKVREINKDINLEDVENMSISELVGVLNNMDREEETDLMETSEGEKTPEPIKTPEQAATPEAVQTPEIPSTTLPEDTISPLPTMEPIEVSDTPPIIDVTSTPKRQEVASNSLKIQYYCEDDNIEPQTIDYSFRILNTSDSVVELKDVKVRYYFKDDTNIPLDLFVYFFSHGNESEVYGEFYKLPEKVNANKYLELRFMTGKIEPGEFVYVQGAIYRKDWSRFDQRDDYSFNADADSYIDWDKMTAYISDVLAWGIEPN